MASLKKAEQAQIRSLMKGNEWDAVLKFFAMKLDQWRSQPIEGKTSFEELRALHKRDGKVEGLIEVLEQLEKQAFDE